MNRLGKALIAIGVLVAIGLASITRFVPARPSGSAPASDRTVLPPMESGTLTIPVAGVKPSELVDSFEDARGGGTRPHHAIDVMAPAGATVRAAADGTIEALKDSEAGGLMVYERIAPTLVAYYGHLAGYAQGLAAGMRVTRGMPLGRVGATGDADPGAPHLHFGIKRLAASDAWYAKGEDVNPYPLLAGKPGGS